MKRRSKSRLRTGNLAMCYCFSLPVMIFLFIFIFLSIAYCFYMSFFEWKLFDLGKDKTFVGLDNYIRIFQDGIFGQAVGNCLLYTSCMVSHSKETMFRSMAMASRIAQMAIIDALVVAVSFKRFERSKQYLTLTDKILVEDKM